MNSEKTIRVDELVNNINNSLHEELVKDVPAITAKLILAAVMLAKTQNYSRKQLHNILDLALRGVK